MIRAWRDNGAASAAEAAGNRQPYAEVWQVSPGRWMAVVGVRGVAGMEYTHLPQAGMEYRSREDAKRAAAAMLRERLAGGAA